MLYQALAEMECTFSGCRNCRSLVDLVATLVGSYQFALHERLHIALVLLHLQGPLMTQATFRNASLVP